MMRYLLFQSILADLFWGWLERRFGMVLMPVSANGREQPVPYRVAEPPAAR